VSLAVEFKSVLMNVNNHALITTDVNLISWLIMLRDFVGSDQLTAFFFTSLHFAYYNLISNRIRELSFHTATRSGTFIFVHYLRVFVVVT